MGEPHSFVDNRAQAQCIMVPTYTELLLQGLKSHRLSPHLIMQPGTYIYLY